MSSKARITNTNTSTQPKLGCSRRSFTRRPQPSTTARSCPTTTLIRPRGRWPTVAIPACTRAGHTTGMPRAPISPSVSAACLTITVVGRPTGVAAIGAAAFGAGTVIGHARTITTVRDTTVATGTTLVVMAVGWIGLPISSAAASGTGTEEIGSVLLAGMPAAGIATVLPTALARCAAIAWAPRAAIARALCAAIARQAHTATAWAACAVRQPIAVSESRARTVRQMAAANGSAAIGRRRVAAEPTSAPAYAVRIARLTAVRRKAVKSCVKAVAGGRWSEVRALSNVAAPGRATQFRAP